MEQSREKSSAPPLHLGVVAIEKGAFWSLSTTVANFAHYIYIYIYIYVYIYIYILFSIFKYSDFTFCKLYWPFKPEKMPTKFRLIQRMLISEILHVNESLVLERFCSGFKRRLVRHHWRCTKKILITLFILATKVKELIFSVKPDDIVVIIDFISLSVCSYKMVVFIPTCQAIFVYS